jgi:predicted AlkP superfamily phosphohydrolase/phosphomutase
MPAFRRLIEEGSRAELSSTSEQLPDTVWACLYTGVNPAKLEKYFYVQYDPATQGLKHVWDDAITATPFWGYLSRAGLRTGVVDAPKFPLNGNFDGFQLTNWGAHATKTAKASNPSSLLKEVQARYGDHPVGDCDKVDDNPRALAELRRRVLEGVHTHGELFRWLMQEQVWDVFFASFSAPHCIGHHFWFGLDPSHPKHSDPARASLADTVRETYQAIDREIGMMVQLAGPDTTVMVFAAHGMGPLQHASWNLPEILNLLGYGNKPAHRSDQPRQARVNPWRILKMVVPGSVQYRIKNMLPRALQDQLLFLWYRGREDWEGRRAFAVPNNDSVGAIRVSVKSRDRNGIVAPGREYETICRDIADALRELRDPATGKHVVRNVTLSSEAFHGPYLHQLPDLTVLWEPGFSWNAVASPRIGELRLRGQDGRSGSHTDYGFLIAVGQGISKGRQLEKNSIYDVAPTILNACGLAEVQGLDGRALPLEAASAAVRRKGA